ncbi:MAG: putative toxin-antitoxin system toxin component, PIN family [Terracidiphilus sp.]|nr:putative toxin-antitoxin system toxin component, PIN family [Terracidiphilus sp.]
MSQRSEVRGSLLRAVFDTNTVVSALLFATGRLAWLRQHWRAGGSVPLISRATAAELTRVLGYPKFRLSPEDRVELLGNYLPWCATVERVERCATECRDPHDQVFLDLAESGKAGVLVTGDQDLLVLAGKTAFSIETPEEYRRRIQEPGHNP